MKKREFRELLRSAFRFGNPDSVINWVLDCAQDAYESGDMPEEVREFFSEEPAEAPK